MDTVALLKKIELDIDSSLDEVSKMVTSKPKHVLEKIKVTKRYAEFKKNYWEKYLTFRYQTRTHRQ